MIEKELVKKLVEEKLKGSDNYPVDISIRPDNLISVEIDNDHGVSIDDCVALSRFIEEYLDREKEDFELEVGSSGITSPFKIVRQYIKNVGNEVEMLLKNGIKLTGILKAAGDDAVVIAVEKKVKPEGSKRKITVEEDQVYSYDEIKYTKYLIRF
ncbi:MAG TPA: ribosome assembly cofactor RimP [Porphyromonadaceae bacterium]|nr:ribosome assembly cofactor RimP [Porphyromonadaceae bacterium]